MFCSRVTGQLARVTLLWMSCYTCFCLSHPEILTSENLLLLSRALALESVQILNTAVVGIDLKSYSGVWAELELKKCGSDCTDSDELLLLVHFYSALSPVHGPSTIVFSQ